SVYAADWSPDGQQLAVAREVDGVRRLEYPLGKVRFETREGWVDMPRVSRDGRSVAFVVHPLRGDNIGYLGLADGDHPARQLDPTGCTGLAWAPRDDALWCSYGNDLIAISRRDGNERRLFASPGTLELEDIAADGRALVAQGSSRRELVVK